MKMKSVTVNMLAPCGMTCSVCYVHLKQRKPCTGCRGRDKGKPEHCRKCEIRDCTANHQINFCFECSSFPCATIKRLDKSYRQRYQVSLVENALRLKTIGMDPYLLEEQIKWTCTHCGGVISLHDQACSECGEKMQQKEQIKK